MFHMLVCFDLKPGVVIDEFRNSVSRFTEHLRGLDLAAGVSPIGARQSHGTLTDQDLDTIVTKVPSAVRMMNPSFHDHKGVAEAIELVRQTLR